MIGGIISGIADLGNSIFNMTSQKKHNENILKLNREQFEYQKQLQQDIFNREDNAVQRRLNDMKKAGFNPLLAAGQGANAGATVANTQLTSGLTQAPQSAMDFQRVAEGVYNMMTMSQDISQSKAQEKLINKQILTETEMPKKVRGEVSKMKSEEYMADSNRQRNMSEIANIQSEIMLRQTEAEAKQYDYWMSRQQNLRTTDKTPSNAVEVGWHAGKAFGGANSKKWKWW